MIDHAKTPGAKSNGIERSIHVCSALESLQLAQDKKMQLSGKRKDIPRACRDILFLINVLFFIFLQSRLPLVLKKRHDHETHSCICCPLLVVWCTCINQKRHVCCITTLLLYRYFSHWRDYAEMAPGMSKTNKQKKLQGVPLFDVVFVRL